MTIDLNDIIENEFNAQDNASGDELAQYADDLAELI